ncbi:MAG TPA: LamG domain-containing protein [Kofleriaceae bacterium]
MRGPAIVLVLAGCYSPSAEDCAYKCSEGACPAGLTCVANYCRVPGAEDTCNGSYVTAVAQSEPIVWWRFSEGPGSTIVKDEMNNADATNSGALLGAAGFLPADRAAVFSGGQMDCMTAGMFGGADFTDASDFTVEAWVAFVSGTGDRPIVGKLGYVGAAEIGWDFRIASSGQLQLRTCNGSTCSTISSSTPVGEDRWWYVAATYRGAATTSDAAEIYVDGVRIGTPIDFVPGPAIAAPSPPLTVGCVQGNPTPGSYFSGALDEIAIYDHALDAQEIAAHFAAGD